LECHAWRLVCRRSFHQSGGLGSGNHRHGWRRIFGSVTVEKTLPEEFFRVRKL
jgi:hypothetical protein